jgi:uncharacterized membrane protein
LNYKTPLIWAVFYSFTGYVVIASIDVMKNFFLYLMVALYVAAGLNHFIKPGFYMRIVPGWVPAPLSLVYISGACEVLFALLLLPTATRPTGAWLLILLLAAIFPANVQMTINYYRSHNPYLWITILRLPLQLVLVWWAWVYTKS